MQKFDWHPEFEKADKTRISITKRGISCDDISPVSDRSMAKGRMQLQRRSPCEKKLR
jgi:hypothetical protein